MKKIVLFGAARMGFEYYSTHKENVCYFFDNDNTKWNTEYEGIKIIAPSFLGDDYEVIVANDKHDIDMVNQLMTIGYRKFSVLYPAGVKDGVSVFGIDEFDYTSIEDMREDKYKVVLIQNTTSGSNTWCLKYMVDNVYKESPFTFILLNTKKKSASYYYDIFTSKTIILTASFTSIKNKVIVQCYHAFPFKADGYMCKNIRDSSFELTHKDMLNANYVLSYSRLYSIVFGSCFGVPVNRFVEIGMPRNDVMLLSDGRTKLYSKYPQMQGKRIILYMPTYRERIIYTDEQGRGYLFLYPDFNGEEFDTFLQENNCIMLIKMHVGDNKNFSWMINRYKNIVFLNDEDFDNSDFYEYINGTDILITDYSSIFIDYLLLDKPIIFSHRDEAEYIEERGLMFDNIDFWCPGSRIRSIEELKNEIIKLVSGKDEYEEHRRQMRKLFHGDYDGKASEKLLELLESYNNR